MKKNNIAPRKLTLKANIICNYSTIQENNFDTGVLVTSFNKICSIP